MANMKASHYGNIPNQEPSTQAEQLLSILERRGIVEDQSIPDEKARMAEKSMRRNMYHNTKMMLKYYRDIVWALECFPQQVAAELDQPFKELDTLLSAVDAQLAMGNTKMEHRLLSIKKSRILLDRINDALTVLRQKPTNGELMYNIIFLTYITPDKLKHSDILFRLNISDRHYYRLRQQAVRMLARSLRLFHAAVGAHSARIGVLALVAAKGTLAVAPAVRLILHGRTRIGIRLKQFAAGRADLVKRAVILVLMRILQMLVDIIARRLTEVRIVMIDVRRMLCAALGRLHRAAAILGADAIRAVLVRETARLVDGFFLGLLAKIALVVLNRAGDRLRMRAVAVVRVGTLALSIVILIPAVLARRGFTLGFAHGFNSGFAFGLAPGFTRGFNLAFARGFTLGFARGFTLGFALGFAAGFARGLNHSFARRLFIRMHMRHKADQLCHAQHERKQTLHLSVIHFYPSFPS